ncbi:NAD(P)H-hydrate dehydratase [Pseudodesulfovibrio cashew]|uniref:Bifunctional NAD(P)H-hydrate repair enzyme n=1 Tax=Pseudodesulfovibrio cashew TaxID=2678688 RepID=A0A6I6JJW5_9BACT|nr:NAD(P)H-hydrate dehydratase [Pseudodesulfovibrio cashew]QGY41258.1 NAD(P)H-hydrate dehydratase [Pseudodesulfovibrio cashew]
MLLPLPTPEEMMLWDRETIQTIGIPGATLMESASREAVDVLLEEYGSVENAEIFCFAGSGNNGGDAFAMARQLADLGADVTVFHTIAKKRYRGETRQNLQWAQKLGVPLRHLSAVNTDSLPQPDIIVDGLLGTGLQGPLRDDYLTLVRSLNRLGKRAFVLAVDIPSGLSGLTGAPLPEAVVADATVTFQAPKLGLAMPGANRFTGMLHVRTIGIPNLVQEKNPASHHLITEEALDRIPGLVHDMHKGTAGHVLIVGGSIGLTGAPHLAARAALRSGAGLVTLACPAGLADSIKHGAPDIMTLPLGQGDEWTADIANDLLSQMDRFDAVVVGPGIGRAQKTVDLLEDFIAKCPARTVLDADALYALSKFPGRIAELPAETILTPHPGEMAMLFASAIPEIQGDRLGCAKRFTKMSEAILVLKGAGTVVTNKDVTAISPFSEPNLSVGGSGDILAGVIGSLLARGVTAIEAACIGVYWHGLAGRMLRKDFPARGNLATEIASALPLAIQHHLKDM